MINICYSYVQGVILYRCSGRVDDNGSDSENRTVSDLRASAHMPRFGRGAQESSV